MSKAFSHTFRLAVRTLPFLALLVAIVAGDAMAETGGGVESAQVAATASAAQSATEVEDTATAADEQAIADAGQPEAAAKPANAKQVAAKLPAKEKAQIEDSIPANVNIVAVEKVRAFRDGDSFTAEIQTSSSWSGNDVQVKYMRDFIQAEISGAFLNKGKELVRVNDRIFKSVYATQNSPSTIRVRFFVKNGKIAKALYGKFHVKRSGSTLALDVTGDADASVVKTVKDNAHTVAVVDESAASDTLNAKLVAGAEPKAEAQEATAAPAVPAAADAKAAAVAAAAPIAASINPVATAADAAAAATDKKADTTKLAENEIPVLATVKESKKSEGGSLFRIIMTLGVAAISLGAAAFGVKKMASRGNSKAQNTRIKVLTTHHLGPKKNLQIVQVAGETLLIGVTDHSISMLKTLSLLDDEIPEAGPQRFNHAISDFAGLDEDENEPIALRGLDQIRDTVSARLKNMRNL